MFCQTSDVKEKAAEAAFDVLFSTFLKFGAVSPAPTF